MLTILRLIFFLIFSLLIYPQKTTAQQPTITSTRPHDEGVERNVSEIDANRSAIFATIDLEFQIASKRSELAALTKLDGLIESLLKNKDSIKDAVRRAMDHAADISCDKDSDKLNDDYASVAKATALYWPINQELQKAEGQTLLPILGNFYMAPAADKCRLLQAEAQHKSVDAALIQLESVAGLQKSKLSELRADLIKLQDKLQKMLNSEGAIQVAKNLYILILIIAGASIAIILVVRCFSIELQMEWVASGQVIQFTTVMILLSALMALGLTGILHEQVLGTLLGGIAGYVLAQGVGRATARATLNAANAANAANSAPSTAARTAAERGSAAAVTRSDPLPSAGTNEK
jgi:hypothetical protein